ncbi:hypothetical protein AX761_21745 [Rhizobium sp. 58]|nr:hypothetical protein AX761_21745 [Rhizobium sp. 58]
MVKLIALEKGYARGRIIAEGEKFSFDDEAWADKKNRPKWAKVDPATVFGGKGDHDGDGSLGGSVSSECGGDGVTEPAKVEKPAKAGKAGKAAKSETVMAPAVEPFAEPPVPETLSENGVQTALGGIQPDWLPPGSDDDGKPVMAED